MTHGLVSNVVIAGESAQAIQRFQASSMGQDETSAKMCPSLLKLENKDSSIKATLHNILHDFDKMYINPATKQHIHPIIVDLNRFFTKTHLFDLNS